MAGYDLSKVSDSNCAEFVGEDRCEVGRLILCDAHKFPEFARFTSAGDVEEESFFGVFGVSKTNNSSIFVGFENRDGAEHFTGSSEE